MIFRIFGPNQLVRLGRTTDRFLTASGVTDEVKRAELCEQIVPQYFQDIEKKPFLVYSNQSVFYYCNQKHRMLRYIITFLMKSSQYLPKY